jgi:hypothetical protein
VERGLTTASDEDAAKLAEDAADCPPVDINVSPVEVAQRLLNPVRLRLTDDPGMLESASSFHGDGQAQFEWHVESRGSGTDVVQLNSREVMDRIFRFCDQAENPIQPPAAQWNLQCGSGNEPEGAGRSDIG